MGIIVLAVLAVAAALAMARAVLIPIVAAVIIGSVIGPLIEALSRRGLPIWVASTLVLLATLLIVYGFAATLAGPLADWVARAPEIAKNLQDRFATVRPAVDSLMTLTKTLESVGRASEAPMTVSLADSKMLESAIGLVTPAIAELILFVGSLLFFLAGRIRIKRKVVQAIGPRQTRLIMLRVFRAIEERLGTYLLTATFINAGLGVATALLTWVLGLPTPLVWGVLAAVLNYIPYIGPAVMTMLLVVVGLVTFSGFLQGLIPAVAFLLLTAVEGQFLTPLIVGRRVSLNPFAVFLSMALWTWLWGSAGTFLAVPLLIAAMALRDALATGRRPQLPG